MHVMTKEQAARFRTDFEEEGNDAYEEEFYAHVEQQRKEYESQFGLAFLAKHPFKQDSIAAHEAAMLKINREVA